MVGDGDARKGYSLTHASMHKGELKTSKTILSLNDYLNKLISCNIVVVRYRKNDENLASQLAHNGLYHASRHTIFDTAKVLNPDLDNAIWKEE